MINEMTQDVPTAKEAERADRSSARGINYPASAVAENMRRLKAEGKIDDEGAAAIQWLHTYACDNGLSYNGIKDVTGIGAAFALFHGEYQASYDNMVKRILAVKDLAEKRAAEHSIGFVTTAAAKTIFSACDAALYDAMPAFIYGASQTGKTTALREYQRLHNHGRTKILRIGVRWTQTKLVEELAKICNCFSAHAKTVEHIDRIVKSLSSRNLLIVDEFHQALTTAPGRASVDIVETLREIYDRTEERDSEHVGCGIVMCATKVGEQEFEQGKFKMLFDQFRRRGIVKIVLPDVPKVADIGKFAKLFNLDAPQGETLMEIKMLVKRAGLKHYIRFLQKAAKVASESKGRLAMSWDLFNEVADGYARLAYAKNEY